MNIKPRLATMLAILALYGLMLPLQPARAEDPVATLVDAFPNLSFANPLFFTVAPGDDSHAYVVTQGGIIYVFDKDADVDTATPFLDISARVTQSGGELGLLGLAFDPDYANNGYFYVNYNPGSGNRRTHIARYSRGDSALTADPDSELLLLQYDQPFPNHNGGWMGFGADGKLYITAGDGGGVGDPSNNAQNLTTPLGKILRINTDGSVPEDNPFVDVAGARGEIWAWGLRNPFRASFDRLTGALWVADVGQDEWEEIDIVTAGGNYGWSKYEGNHVYDADEPEPENPIFPVHEYNHDNGRCSIQGGYVYRGSDVLSLQGAYLFADYCSGTVWALTGDSEQGYASSVLFTAPGNPTSFGEDHDGEVYITSYDGHIYRFAPFDGTPVAPAATLSETGLFADTASLRPARGTLPYGVNAAFWSDGAIKSRWFNLPEGSQIGFSADSAWTFPVGTRLVKHFEMDLANGTRTRLETRVMERGAINWYGYTYRWREDQLDADLLTEGATTELLVADANGQTVTQLYEFPSSSACLACHTSAAGYGLGVGTAQLNGRYEYGRGPRGETSNQLIYLSAQGVFDTALTSPWRYDKLPDPTFAAGNLSRRARAYLQTNCSQCHQPGGPTPVNMDLRYDTPIEDTETVGVPAIANELGNYRIAPGDKEDSVVWQRMRVLDGQRMPPIGSHVVDEAGVELIGSWIDAGAP